MNWLNRVKYGQPLTGGVKLAGRSNLYTHRALPGILLKTVRSRNDLMACNGFVILDAAGHPVWGAVGKTARAAYEEVDLPRIQPMVSTWASGTAGSMAKGTTSVYPLAGYNAADKTGFTRLMPLPDVMTSVRDFYVDAYPTVVTQQRQGSYEAASWMKPLVVAQAQQANYSVVGVISAAEAGQFAFSDGTGQLASDGITATSSRLANTPGTALLFPIVHGWLATRIEVGVIGKLIDDMSPALAAAVSEDARPYFAQAVKEYVSAHPHRSRKAYMSFVSTISQVGNRGNYVVEHGLSEFSAPLLHIRATNSDSTPQVVGFVTHPGDENPLIFNAPRVKGVSGGKTSSLFGSLAAGHCLAAAANNDENKFEPLITSGGSLDDAARSIGSYYALISTPMQAQVATSTVVLDGANVTRKSLKPVSTDHPLVTGFYKSHYGHKIYLDLHEGMAWIYKRAEELIEDEEE